MRDDFGTGRKPTPGFKQAVMWCLLFLFPVCHSSLTNKFDVITSDDPVPAWLGSSVTLPCTVTPALPTESLEVRWHQPNNYTSPVLLYQHQKIQQQPANPQYRGRVSLVGELVKGNLSLSITNVTLADKGEYVCFVSEVRQGYKDANVHLNVKAKGSPPVLSIADGGSGKVNITCESEGWFPQPTLTWRSQGGIEITAQNDHRTTDTHGFVRVTSWLLCSPSETEWLSCSVGLPEEKWKESRIVPYFLRTNEGLWKDIVLVLILVVSCLLFIIFLCRKVWLRYTSAPAGEKLEVVRIVLLGKTGMGKSATGNTILGRKSFRSKLKAKEDKLHCEKRTRKMDGRELHVIDTPALFDIDADVEKQIQKCISLSSPGPHAFLLITELGSRKPSELIEMKEKIKRFFGEESSKYTIALFTHGDKLEDTTIEDFVKENQELQEFVGLCGGGCHVFNNKDKRNRSQVTELLMKIDEMVKTNGGPYTAMDQTDECQQEQKTALLGDIEHQTALGNVIELH